MGCSIWNVLFFKLVAIFSVILQFACIILLKWETELWQKENVNERSPPPHSSKPPPPPHNQKTFLTIKLAQKKPKISIRLENMFSLILCKKKRNASGGRLHFKIVKKKRILRIPNF